MRLAAGVVLGILLTISIQVWAFAEATLDDGSLIYILTKDEMDGLKASIARLIADRDHWRSFANKIGCI